MQAPGDDSHVDAVPEKREVDLVLGDAHSFLVQTCFDVDDESGYITKGQQREWEIGKVFAL